jgi:hypothetical protein
MQRYTCQSRIIILNDALFVSPNDAERLPGLIILLCYNKEFCSKLAYRVMRKAKNYDEAVIFSKFN